MKERPLRHEWEEHRTLPALAMALMGGIWAASRTLPGNWAWLLLPLALAAGLVAWREGRRPMLALTLAMLALALPLTWARLYPATPPVGRYAIEATAYGNPRVRDEEQMTFLLTNVTLDGEPVAGKAYCSYNDRTGAPMPTLFDGARLAFTGSVYIPSGKENEYDFDFRLWLLQKGVTYGISGVRELRLLNDRQSAPWTDVATRIRNACESAFASVMGDRSRFAMAMLLGETDGLQSDEQQAFRTTGVAHVLAVSGLHVGLMAELFVGLLKRLKVSRRRRFPAIAAFLLAYCFVTGFSPASLRAAVMYLLLMLSRALGRRNDPLSTLSAAAMLVLLLNPLQLFSASFVLSFSATAGILLLYRPLEARLTRWLKPAPKRKRRPSAKLSLVRKRGVRAYLQAVAANHRDRLATLPQRMLRGGLQMLAVSLSAQIGVLLPTACFFNRMPLYGVLINLLVVPLVGLLVPLYAIPLAVSWIPLLGTAAGFVAKAGTDLLLRLIELGARLPYASVRIPSASLPMIVGLILCAVVAAQLFAATRKRRVALVALLLVVAAVGSYAVRPPSLRYHQFAVGQGDAALLIDGDQTIAVDVGPYGYEVAQRLMAEGRDVDALVLTHLHLDHAQGVAELLASGIRVGCTYIPDGADTRLNDETGEALQLLTDAGVPIRSLASGDRLTFRDASVTALWPERGKWRSGVSLNDRSMALRIELGGVRILCMGDLGDGYDAYVAEPCDVLKVGHHGSAEATGDAFLRTASPTIAVVTCRSGSDSLPAAETLERLADSGAAIYRTDETGEIVIVPQDDGYRVVTYKARNGY